MNSEKVLAGQVAVVTGAAKGIGAGVARSLAGAGASVVVNYASAKADADRVVSAITAEGGRAISVQADVSREADVERLFEETRAAFDRVDILVNCAGVYSFGPLEQISVAEFHRQYDVNVLGVLLTTKAFAAQADHGGAIINIGSAASSLLGVGSMLYASTKCAVDGITVVASRELAGRKIRVNSVNPGPTATEGARALGIVEGGEMERQMVATVPLGRMGLPSDIGPVAVFLASDAARWVTGETIVASGGLR